jgi:hypothetical protein
MAASNPNDPTTTTTTPTRPAPVNPSVESTRIDDARSRRAHDDEKIAGAAVGVGATFLGMALLPWLMVALGIIAAVVVAVVAGWFK